VSASDTTRLAVLIDSDNTTANLTTELLAEIATFGTPTRSGIVSSAPGRIVGSCPAAHQAASGAR
jgi:hypothetical protein